MAYQDGDCSKEPQPNLDDAVDQVEALGFQALPWALALLGLCL